jgi:uncharacterized protein
MVDVGDKLLGKFADCLAEELADDREAEPEPAGEDDAGTPQVAEAAAAAADAGTVPVGDEAASAAVAAAADPVTSSPAATGPAPTVPMAARQPAQRRTDDTIDLLDVAGAPVAKRAAPIVVGLALLALIIWLVRRR